MSGQPQTNRVPGPMKAVMPFHLRGTHSPSASSPTQSRSPFRTDRRSPVNSPNAKAEKSKPVHACPSSSLRRTNSLDTIGPCYLAGRWPVDTGSHGSFMRDKFTQAPDDLKDEVHMKENKVERKKKKHRRSASFGHADKKQPLELSSIRQKIKSNKGLETKQRVSPVPANHNALLQTAPAVLMRSVPIPVVNFQRSTHRSCPRNSLEGDNGEVEYLVERLETTMHIEGETERMIQIPDGHRAPVPAGTRSIDTQTPSSSSRGSEELLLNERFSGRNSGRSSGGRSSCSPVFNSPFPSQSYSPTIPIMAGVVSMDSSPRPSSSYDSSGSTPRDAKSDKEPGDLERLSPEVHNKKAASPKPKFVREPPDGCEKVQSNEEDSQPSIKEPLLFCPIVKTKFELKPSQRSAFCPLKKLYTPPTFTSTSTSASIEGH
ncbi:protein FAM117B-like isoform X2 [Dreissena polymorpha]|uniref:protein FAM117B-like isoform X2 n=1 Tax=Dreissena polymorpha TaxID=45954 RepID=UPI002263B781|nr:protein FAM117B-like isoform X2 [Dreissena polymorpha]